MKKSELKRLIVQLTNLLEIRDEEIRHLKDDFLMLRDDVAYHVKGNNELVEKLNELRGENAKLESKNNELEKELGAIHMQNASDHFNGLVDDPKVKKVDSQRVVLDSPETINLVANKALEMVGELHDITKGGWENDLVKNDDDAHLYHASRIHMYECIFPELKSFDVGDFVERAFDLAKSMRDKSGEADND